MFYFFPSSSEVMSNCLSHVNLIPPYDRVVLQTTFSKLSRWAVDALRRHVISANVMLNDSGVLGMLPQARFILATIGLLSTEHLASGVSLLLNSGVLGLTQAILRLALAGRKNTFKQAWNLNIFLECKIKPFEVEAQFMNFKVQL